MATIYINSTRKVDSSNYQSKGAVSLDLINGGNLTYGEGKLGAVTVTGTVYNVEDYIVKYRNPSGIVVREDMGDQLYGATATYILPIRMAERIDKTVNEYFTEKAQDGIHEIQVGVIVEATKLELVDGVHPTLGTPTKNLLVQVDRFIGVETPEKVIFSGDEFIEDTKKAAELANSNGKLGLSLYQQAKQAAANLLTTGSLTAAKDLSETKKTTRKKVTTLD
jgi:hypothetical protein